ncbi:ATP-grasp ribosomal peptide maturase [Amycolatopsis rubida]|uniref:ATP-grasp ribosomal peptide maturase n=2 Tax=Amycolatopsis rubida TaxID=112413 RepID=A0ABX0BXU9_9PSEU|nr:MULTISPECIES: ATP-grasp ribosomal peptide maturase [Amycolatopsis]MYW95238.1 ATP-grasp ribosomal peptide maturase [Amycolatopsis rubida]NEC60226.1 ATP-grasp ribosomal peptide maturase [Amycolatopsis rubida]OAP28364.1 RimK-like ATP-grasp domain protein [Amycolatopsis sp. M39]
MKLESDLAASTVLVLTEPTDKSADLVVRELERRNARVFRADTGDFPLSVSVSAWFDGSWEGEIRSPDGSVGLRDIRSVYVRRPTAFTFPATMNDAEQRFAAREARRAFGGLLMSLPWCSWVNDPSKAADAEYKPLQLATAAACGLRVPRTAITNVPGDAVGLRDRLGDSVVYKTLSGASVPDGQRVSLVYTTPVTVADMADDRIALTAHQFQERMPKIRDVRATVVGRRVFAANILVADEDAGELLDWRADYTALRYEPVSLPESVESALLKMTDHLGLAFAAADFVVTADDTHYFVDLNPSGQWGWIEDATALPIADAIAALLTGEDQ